MPYQIVETRNEAISKIENNILDPGIPVEEDNKERKNKLKKLEEVLRFILEQEIDNPCFSSIIPKIRNLLDLIIKLRRIYSNFRRESAKLIGTDRTVFLTINKELIIIVKTIEDWLELIKPKIEEVRKGNHHLRDLKLHPYKTRFYVKVKELNPNYTMLMIHPINEKQAAIQRNRTTEELLLLDRKDPVTGARGFRSGDNPAYPGSQVIVTNGHHRLYELYRRYLQGRVNGNTLVEFMIDEKFIKKR